MTTRYFTFGQNHLHEIDGVVFDRNIVVKITAADEALCRQKMFDTFGWRWSMIYDSPREIRWYPRGVIEL